jgi:tRNA-dihydrouridine synthase B
MPIDTLAIDTPFMLAPLAGVSDSPFRQLAREQGAGVVYTEMVSADGLIRGSKPTFELCAFESHERPIGIQLFGSDPGIMAEAARVLCDLPAERRPDLIDINMGCPVRKVVNRKAGAALLTEPARIHDIVSRMSEASTLPVTAKIRLGWDGQSRNAVEVCKVLEGAGAKAVAIHARTRAEKFEGEAHWDMIGEAKRAVGIPVIGNGDVRSAEDAMRMLDSTGCDAVMLGRAAFGDPWIFRRLRAFHERGETLPMPAPSERLEAGLKHLALMIRHAGPESASREMRKHVAWYVKGLPNSHRVRERINHTRSVDEMEDLLRGYLEELIQMGDMAYAGDTAEASAPAGADPTQGPTVAAG